MEKPQTENILDVVLCIKCNYKWAINNRAQVIFESNNVQEFIKNSFIILHILLEKETFIIFYFKVNWFA